MITFFPNKSRKKLAIFIIFIKAQKQVSYPKRLRRYIPQALSPILTSLFSKTYTLCYHFSS